MTRKPNLDHDQVQKLLANIGEYEWINDHAEDEQHGTYPKDTVSPMDIMDYAYAMLHSPSYREKYQEFLKTDFPRVPPAADADNFWKLVELGSRLRQLHLMDTSMVEDYDTTFPVAGSNEVEKVSFVIPDAVPESNSKEILSQVQDDKEGDEKIGRVYINTDQYFGNVPEVAWNFYIGGYQPAQKWLKDRKGRTLSNNDLDHYQKIIKVLVETDKTMQEIDEI